VSQLAILGLAGIVLVAVLFRRPSQWRARPKGSQLQAAVHSSNSAVSKVEATPPWMTSSLFLPPSAWMDEDNPSATSVGFAPRTTCPKIYVYNLPELFQDVGPDVNLSFAFGDLLDPPPVIGAHRTNQYSIAAVFLYRLVRSPGCYTTNAKEADLFFIPMLPGQRMMHPYAMRCRLIQTRLIELADHLPHLSTQTAHRHFFLSNQKFLQVRNVCLNVTKPALIAVKTQELDDFIALLRSVPFLSTETAFTQAEVSLFPHLERETHELWNLIRFICTPQDCDALTFAVPRPSSIHWSTRYAAADAPWRPWNHNRNILLSYVGQTIHGDVAAREIVGKWCEHYSGGSDLVCLHDPSEMLEENFLDLKSRSIFCLEPVGDTPSRKSTGDDYACGCIPVFIGVAQAFTYPFHWREWRDSAFVVMDESLFKSGMVDPVVALKTIDPKYISLLHGQIARYGSRFQYSVEKVPGMEDGFDLLLQILWHASQPATQQKFKEAAFAYDVRATVSSRRRYDDAVGRPMRRRTTTTTPKPCEQPAI